MTRGLRMWLFLLTVGLSPVGPPVIANATGLPSGFAETRVASGISSPTAMDFAPDGRLFICEQGGRLVIVKNGVLQSQSFLNLTNVVDDSGERGLLGVALHPSFATTQLVYVYYTLNSSPRRNRVSRFTASGDTAVPGSEAVILESETLSGATNHNAGAIHFGPDGKLYVAVGDNANGANAQSLSTRLGKMLRLNPDGTIPTDNPFYNTATGVNRAIWALGLRNPFTFAFQPGSSRMFINDVGQNSWEEINEGVPGANYGWPATEGMTTASGYRSPLLAYGHGGDPSTTGCSIAGGAFYDPATASFPPSYKGKYFYADYCGGWIRTYDPVTRSSGSFATGTSYPVDLKVSSVGHLYYLGRGSGSTTGAVYRISYTASQAPSISTHPASRTVPVGGSVTFSVTASGTAPLAYQWQRNGANLTGATAATYTIPAVSTADSGASFRVIVSNASGSATSNTATLTVTSNTPPGGTITGPTSGALYTAGATVTYAGSATDAEDGILPASAFTWEVVFHHDTHTHPFILPTAGAKSGSFVISTTGHTESNVWYRIHLTVTDSRGLTQRSFVDLRPRTVTLQVATVPAGLQVTLDDQPKATPLSIVSVVGVRRKLGAPSPQTRSGTSYAFTAWSDGGAATHMISTPAANTTYTASYRAGSTTPTCPCTIWSGTTTPAVAAYADPNPVELGVRFQSGVAGSISGLRFYKGPGNSGPHVVSLWTGTGALLARTVLATESATGWQQGTFAKPVPIAANTTYVASYFAPAGHYAVNTRSFAAGGVNAAPLRALANSEGGNGVFRYSSASAFPNQTFNANNYWVDVVFSPTAPSACPCTIWNAATTPALAADPDRLPVELGVRFQSVVAGSISGLRFYKGPGNTGTHIANLWSSSGTLLARATFTSESAGGWQSVTFANPVRIVTNTTYVASYFAPAGHYAANGRYFAFGGVAAPPLQALAQSAGGNGVFRYSASTAFPNQTFNGNNYWVDVVFTPTP